jgi:hypothetical protein
MACFLARAGAMLPRKVNFGNYILRSVSSKWQRQCTTQNYKIWKPTVTIHLTANCHTKYQMYLIQLQQTSTRCATCNSDYYWMQVLIAVNISGEVGSAQRTQRSIRSHTNFVEFELRVSVHRGLMSKIPTRCSKSSLFFFVLLLYMFRALHSPIIRSLNCTSGYGVTL